MDQTGSLDTERGFLNKWEMYKALRNQANSPYNLPKTELMSIQSLQGMIEKYRSIYIKPVDSWGGKNISRISKTAGQRYSWFKHDNTHQDYCLLSELVPNVLEFYNGKDCIVQQEILFVRYEGRPFDIRVHMQRDVEDNWVFAGSLVRCAGSTRSIISNVEISKGSVLPTDYALIRAFGKRKLKKSLENRIKQLEAIGYWICKRLESYRKFNDIGIDLGIDRSGRLWLIEVNTDDALGGPSHELFAQLPDQTLYEQIRKRHEERQMGMAQWLIEAFFTSSEID